MNTQELYDELTQHPYIAIRDNNDGMAWLTLIHAKSRRELSRKVKAQNWEKSTGSGADCTGRCFAGSCDLLRAYLVGKKWVGVVYCTNSYDV